ncbi:MAG: AsmA family protein [Bradyrhizobiaceae bacterium]|nr:MAG: AsmA family protein [Bradyrhizobiaceae bacterium]
MQTTLLGLAIAFILALIAALVGPFFIDWNQYRPQFEAEASRVIGAPVRVEGALDARLLPAPILRLRKLAIGSSAGKPGDAGKVSADKLDVEFSLSSLLRGEWRATELSLDGFNLDIGLDKEGRIDWPSSKGSFNLGALAIDRLNLNGRVHLSDAASGTQLALDDLVFTGDVRALATSLRGEGTFTLAGARTPFHVATSQTPDNKGVRVKLTLDPGERPLAADLDAVISFAGQSPRLDGALTLARSVQTGSQMPWRISTKLKADPAAASFDEMEWAYGPDDAALKLNGSGSAQFGASPKFQARLSAQQLDADRLLAKSGRSAPIDLLASLRNVITASPAAPLPVQVSADVDQITLGGKPVQNFSAALRGDTDGWTLDRFEATAPGATRVGISGAIRGGRFDGPLKIDARASQSFQDWYFGQPQTPYRTETPLALAATAGLTKDGFELSDLKITADGNRLDGRVTRSGERIEAALQSAAFDLGNPGDAADRFDRLKTLLPPQAKLSLDLMRATLGGKIIGPLAFDLDYQGSAQTSGTKLGLAVGRADLAPWLGMTLPVSGLNANLTITGDKFSLTGLDGKLGDASVKGSLAFTRGDETGIDGDLVFDTLDLAPLTVAALGGAGIASADPLGSGWLQGWRGKVTFRASRAALPGGMTATDLVGALRGDGQSLFADDLKAALGGGDVGAKLQASRGASGTTISAQVQVTNADGDALKYRALALPEGKASLQATLSSEGRSLAALTNALAGSGVLSLEGARIEGLDTGAFDAAMRVSEGGQVLDDSRLKAIVDPVMAQGALAINTAQIPFDIRDGRLRVAATSIDADNARAVISGGYDIPADQADIRVTLSSLTLGTATSRPELQIFLHGTPDALDRSLDVSSLSSWLSLQAIERETRRLDQLERGGPPPPASSPHSDAPPAATPAPGGDARKRALKPAAAAIPLPPSVTAEHQQLTPLPPPITIRPAPGVRAKKPAPRDLPPVGTSFQSGR